MTDRQEEPATDLTGVIRKMEIFARARRRDAEDNRDAPGNINAAVATVIEAWINQLRAAPSLLQERDRLDVDEMLATERRKTVARIRERLDEAAISMRGWQDRDYRYIPEYRVASILDEASWTATDDGAPFDVNLQHRHYFEDGRLQDWETCPDDNHASDLHALLAVRDQLSVEGLRIIPYKPEQPSTATQEPTDD